MHRRTTPKVFAHSRELRHNTTPAEQKLWTALRACQPENVHFRRQHAIGNYIVDFCAVDHNLIVELDGGQHSQNRAKDAERTRFLEKEGFRVIRFWDDLVFKNLDAVLEEIYRNL